MQTINICITVPDGVSFTVNALPAGELHNSSSVVQGEIQHVVTETISHGLTIEDLKRAFVDALGRGGKERAFSALGVKVCSDVPVAEYRNVIERLKGV